MILLDTHAWIYWVSGSTDLSRRAKNQIRLHKEILIHVFSCLEVSLLVEKGRIELSVPLELWIKNALSHPKINLIGLTPEQAITSTKLPGTFHRDPADRILAATCLLENYTMISADSKIKDWGYIDIIW